MVSVWEPTIEIQQADGSTMDSYVMVLAASSGKNLTLANQFCQSFEQQGMPTKMIDLTTCIGRFTRQNLMVILSENLPLRWSQN